MVLCFGPMHLEQFIANFSYGYTMFLVSLATYNAHLPLVKLTLGMQQGAVSIIIISSLLFTLDIMHVYF